MASPVWEVSASISRVGAAGPTPIMVLGRKHGSLLVAKCRELVESVGDHDAGFWHTDSIAVHWRLPLTTVELDLLPEGWCAIPGVHRGGHEDRMTKEPPWV